MSSFTAVQRVKKEIRDLPRYRDETIRMELVGEKWTELCGFIKGPDDCPYEGGTFKIEINVPDIYPFKPPCVRFMTKVWHPNISSVTGAICLNILQNEWSTDLTLRNVLLFLQELLLSPEPTNPQDAVVARQALFAPNMFKQTARYWTYVFANGPVGLTEFDDKVKQLLDMGFEEHASRVALSSKDWEVNFAVDYLVE